MRNGPVSFEIYGLEKGQLAMAMIASARAMLCSTRGIQCCEEPSLGGSDVIWRIMMELLTMVFVQDELNEGLHHTAESLNANIHHAQEVLAENLEHGKDVMEEKMDLAKQKLEESGALDQAKQLMGKLGAQGQQGMCSVCLNISVGGVVGILSGVCCCR